jgi:hypothetical protein
MKTPNPKLPLSRLTLLPLTTAQLAGAQGGEGAVRTVVLPSDACGVPY